MWVKLLRFAGAVPVAVRTPYGQCAGFADASTLVADGHEARPCKALWHTQSATRTAHFPRCRLIIGVM